MKHTRKDYMQGNVTYAEYYGQFVTPQIIEAVKRAFGEDNLREAYALDKNLNNIQLGRWDILTANIPHSVRQDVCRASCGGYSLSDGVCILKRAAEILVKGA